MKGSDGTNATNDVTAAVGGVRLANIGQCSGVAEDREGLLELGKVVGTDDDRSRSTVAGDRHPLVLVLDAVDDFAQVVTNLA